MVLVVKHTGEKEEFDTRKVEYALRRSGASIEVAGEIAREVESRITDGISTQKIYRMAFSLLSKRDSPSAARFGLKMAIMRLGPTGFPFEKYVARLLSEHGYKTKTNQILSGKCVSQEVDVIAKKGNERYMIECKYHNHRGLSTDIKEAMYTQARFEDLILSGHDFSHPWLMCNTKITSTAIKYAECTGMRTTAWSHPADGSLQDLIEHERLYPITILRRVTKDVKNRLAKKNLLLVKDIAGLSPEELSVATCIPKEKLRPISKELKGIMGK